MDDKDQARLLRDEASRLRQQLRETSDRLKAVNAEITALELARSCAEPQKPSVGSREASPESDAAQRKATAEDGRLS